MQSDQQQYIKQQTLGIGVLMGNTKFFIVPKNTIANHSQVFFFLLPKTKNVLSFNYNLYHEHLPYKTVT